MLEVRRLRKEFQPLSGPGLVALGDVSFRVEAGQFVSVVGPSGCGKSTLLQCLAGLLRPTAGQVLFEGGEVTGPPEGLILLFQEYNKSLMAWRSVLGNVRFGLEGRAGLSRADRDAEARRHLELVGLSGFERHYPWELSGGMRSAWPSRAPWPASPRPTAAGRPRRRRRAHPGARVASVWRDRCRR
jgi:NitT/TauT family transport system ATP-binding protein